MKLKTVALVIFLPLFLTGQEISNFIIIDQFGYLPHSEKIAFIKNPKDGYDSEADFSPGTTFQLVNSQSDEVVFEAEPIPWRNGQTDPVSGDQVWRFDFSQASEEGTYFILDKDQNLRSFEFEIKENIYEEILKQAFRTFYYQRAGHSKVVPFADPAWADGASHLGTLQDRNCRPYNAPTNASEEKDLSGGWYDAGDYNKYTNWTADYVIELLRAYIERPDAFGDDYNIPESGNGRPDILDEVKWGMDHLLKMQNEDGSVISIVSLSHASPPSSATGQSLYGGVNTSAALSCAAAFALGAKVYRDIGMDGYSNKLENAALKAWNWAEINPNVIWRNNDSSFGSSGIGAGQQEVDDYGRFTKKLRASLFLYELSKNDSFKNYFENNYQNTHLFQWTFAYPFELDVQETLLNALNAEGINEAVKSAIRGIYLTAMNKETNWPTMDNDQDGYGSYMKDYTWGSNNIKCRKGLMYYDFLTFDLDESRSEDAIRVASRFIHYIHGVNPLNFVYLSNMYEFGAEQGVNEVYHTWFQNGSTLWDRVGESEFGPAPGFLVGGPNPGYDWDGCCPSGCGSASNNAKCNSENLSPPKNQPTAKSYRDFNTSWPLNSWSVTENSCGYQVSYIRLLSKYVSGKFIDCSDGDCATKIHEIKPSKNEVKLFPNPSSSEVRIASSCQDCSWKLYDMNGHLIKEGTNSSFNVENLHPGVYGFTLNGAVKKLVVISKP